MATAYVLTNFKVHFGSCCLRTHHYTGGLNSCRLEQHHTAAFTRVLSLQGVLSPTQGTALTRFSIAPVILRVEAPSCWCLG